MNKLTRDFYERDPLIVTKELLGKYIVRKKNNINLIGKIVEVEAYIGPEDKASHSYNNRKSVRTKVQYSERGLAYPFNIYGMYVCFCIVIGPKYQPAVALIRAVEPVEGLELMKENRKTDALKNLTNGPSKFCQAFGITMDHYGLDLCGDELYLTEGEPVEEISAGPRINIDYAEEFIDKEWRFFIKGNGFVSKIK